MPSVGTFLDLLEAVSRRDWSSIERIGKAAAEEERKRKHFQAAHKILEALEVATSRFSLQDTIGTIASPILPINGKPSELLEEVELDGVSNLVLDKKLELQLDELIGEWNHETKLREKGLSPRRVILLHGPPGCGKSHFAKYLSKELQMRLFIVRFDSLVSSYLGETGSNLREIFDFISKNRCVLFIDELDAIAKLRDDKNELGELKRVVISLLQNLDSISGNSIVISATNHPHMLDLAIWRRFEVIFELMPPLAAERCSLFEYYLNSEIPKSIQNLLSLSTENMTGSDIVQICKSVKRREAIHSLSNQSFSPLFMCIIEYLKRLSPSISNKVDERRVFAALALKTVCDNDFSFQELEHISEVPHSTIHNRFTKWTLEKCQSKI